MPKAKTNKSARKRFKLTATGKVRRYRAFKGHMRQTKSSKRKRSIRKHTLCAPGDARVAKMMIAPSY